MVYGLGLRLNLQMLQGLQRLVLMQLTFLMTSAPSLILKASTPCHVMARVQQNDF